MGEGYQAEKGTGNSESLCLDTVSTWSIFWWSQLVTSVKHMVFLHQVDQNRLKLLCLLFGIL